MSTKQPEFNLSNRLALSLEEVGQVLGVSGTHIRSLRHELPCVHLGRRTVVPVHCLREYLQRKVETEQGRVDSVVSDMLRGLGEGA